MQSVEIRLRAAIDSSLSGILMIDSVGTIVLVNTEIERMFGYSREELVGKNVEMLLPMRHRDEHVRMRESFLANPRRRAMGSGRELFALRKDGVEVPVEIGLAPVVSQEGMFVVASILDLRATRQAERQFRIAVESSPNGMVTIDRDGRIQMVNLELERMFGYSRDELLGQSIEHLVPQRFHSIHPIYRANYYSDPAKRPMGRGRDLYGVRKDGSEFPVEIGLNPIESVDGLLVLGSIVDISARKKAELDRHRLEEQLRHAQKMEAIGTLAGGIAHDFNNVLSAIVGYAELIDSQLDPDSATRADLALLLRAADRGKQVMQRILTFSRRQETARRPIDLAQVIGDALKMLRATLPSSVRMDFSPEEDTPRILGDSTALHQVLMNLVTNSAYALQNRGTIDVAVRSQYVHDSFARTRPELHEGNYGVVTVRDFGPGMPRNVLDRAFEPFFTTKDPGNGTGLGLSMVHAIVRDHDGLVEIESELGRGTIVKCYFPALECEIREERTESTVAPLGRGERVLFVDDEHDLAQLGARRLSLLGYQVEAFSDVDRAVAAFERDPSDFAIVVTDYYMPKMTGLEFARRLRATRADLPIVMLTGVVEAIPAAEIEGSGIRRVLGKPVRSQDLATVIRALIDASVSV